MRLLNLTRQFLTRTAAEYIRSQKRVIHVDPMTDCRPFFPGHGPHSLLLPLLPLRRTKYCRHFRPSPRNRAFSSAPVVPTTPSNGTNGALPPPPQPASVTHHRVEGRGCPRRRDDGLVDQLVQHPEHAENLYLLPLHCRSKGPIARHHNAVLNLRHNNRRKVLRRRAGIVGTDFSNPV